MQRFNLANVSLYLFVYLFINRYLIDSHWFKQWKKYVGFDSWDKYQMGDQNVYPGPVDNSGLLKGQSELLISWNGAKTCFIFTLRRYDVLPQP